MATTAVMVLDLTTVHAKATIRIPTFRRKHMLKKILAFIVMLYAAVAFAAVDVNKASAAELDGIKGIGPAISGKIIEERKKGNFKDWDDFIVRVKGVGEGNAAKFSAEGLTVGGSAYKAAAAPAKAADAKPAAATTTAAATTAAAPAAADTKKDPKAEAKMKADEAKAKAAVDKQAKADEKKKMADENKAKKEAAKKAKADAKMAKADAAKPAASAATK